MMKTNLLARKVILLVCIGLFSIGTTFAQEVNVAPAFNSLLDAVIANPDGATFILERGQIYVIDQQIEVNAPSTFKCAAEPAATMPAVVQYFANPGEGADKTIFACQADATFENIGFMGFTPDEQQVGINIFCLKDSLEIIIDGCVFQGSKFCFANDEFDGLKYTAKNNIYFNVNPVGQDNSAGYVNLWGGTGQELTMQNNTYFVSNRCFNFANAGPLGDEVLNHNTYVNTWGDPFFPVIIENFTLKNSLFYNANIRGYVGTRYNDDGTISYAGDYSDYSLDTIAGDLCVYPHASDEGDGRILAVHNNMKMYEQKVLEFYTENDIMKNPLVSPTTMVLAAENGWGIQDNLLQADGNSLDPEFAMGAIPDGVFTNEFKQAIERRLPAAEQGEGYPYDLSWRPGDEGKGDFIWPLPFDLKPTNEATWKLGDDGYPLGDLNWFDAEVMEAWEAGEDNPLHFTGLNKIKAAGLEMSNFPNPFGTSTKITYSIAENSMVVMTVYNVSGAEVATLVNENQSAGSHEVQFSGNELESGMYFCKLQAGHKVVIRKIALVK